MIQFLTVVLIPVIQMTQRFFFADNTENEHNSQAIKTSTNV